MIYLDNAATSFPKPENVYQAVDDCLRNFAANPGRSGHKLALRAAREIYDTREALAGFFNIDDPCQVVFTANATDSLNIALKGFLNKGDHVIISSMEHNSLARPVRALEKDGITNTVVVCQKDGSFSMEALKQAIGPNTALIAMLHASNLTGTLLPIKEIGALAKEKGIAFLVDASQSAGVYEIDVKDMNIDFLCLPGHKSLLGIQGTGILYVHPRFSLKTIKEGGTGSKSSELDQPFLMPDRLESGTLNTPGIVSIKAGLEFILSEGMAKIRRHEEELTQYLIDELLDIENLTLYGPHDSQKQASVVSFNLSNRDCSETAFLLDSEYDIYCRPGLHCAPLAHRTIGTKKSGAVRLSIGYFNTQDDIAMAVAAIQALAKIK